MRDGTLVIDGIVVNEPADLQAAYAASVDKWGFTPEGIFYRNSPWNHVRKIQRYAELLSDLLRWQPDAQIVDIGCGYGSLARHIPSGNYTGLDLMPQLVAEARRRYPQHRFIEGILGDLDGIIADYGVLVGAMSCVPNPFDMVEQAWEMCRRAVWVDFTMADLVPPGGANPESRHYSKPEVDEKLRELGGRMTSRHLNGTRYYLYQLEHIK